MPDEELIQSFKVRCNHCESHIVGESGYNRDLTWLMAEGLGFKKTNGGVFDDTNTSYGVCVSELCRKFERELGI